MYSISSYFIIFPIVGQLISAQGDPANANFGFEVHMTPDDDLLTLDDSLAVDGTTFGNYETPSGKIQQQEVMTYSGMTVGITTTNDDCQSMGCWFINDFIGTIIGYCYIFITYFKLVPNGFRRIS